MNNKNIRGTNEENARKSLKMSQVLVFWRSIGKERDMHSTRWVTPLRWGRGRCYWKHPLMCYCQGSKPCKRAFQILMDRYMHEKSRGKCQMLVTPIFTCPCPYYVLLMACRESRIPTAQVTNQLPFQGKRLPCFEQKTTVCCRSQPVCNLLLSHQHATRNLQTKHTLHFHWAVFSGSFNLLSFQV